MRWTYPLLVVVIWAGTARADGIESAINEAGLVGKPLLVEFHADWCSPCKQFEQTTLQDARVHDALNSVVFVRYDIDDGANGTAASDLYDVTSVPTLLVIDKFGVEQFRTTGALVGPGGVDAFLALIAKARDIAGDESAMRKKLREHTDAATRLEVAHWFLTHDKAKEALPIFDTISVDTSATSTQRVSAVRAAAHRRRTNVWKAEVVAEKVALIKASPDDATDEDILVAAVESGLAAKDRHEILEAVLERVVDVERLNRRVRIALAAHEDQLALTYAKRAAELRRDVPYMVTLAECYQATGDHERASTLIEEAVAMSKWSSNYGDVLAARKRIAGAAGESSAVLDVRKQARELWLRLERADELEKVVAKPRRDDAHDKRIQQSFMQRFTLARNLGKGCKADAGTTKLAVARVNIDASGAMTSHVWLLEPGVPSTLQPCLDRQIQGAALSGPEVDAMLVVRFE